MYGLNDKVTNCCLHELEPSAYIDARGPLGYMLGRLPMCQMQGCPWSVRQVFDSLHLAYDEVLGFGSLRWLLNGPYIVP